MVKGHEGLSKIIHLNKKRQNKKFVKNNKKMNICKKKNFNNNNLNVFSIFPFRAICTIDARQTVNNLEVSENKKVARWLTELNESVQQKAIASR